MPKKTKKISGEVEEKTSAKSMSIVHMRDEEKCAVSIGLVFGIAYLVTGALVTASPTTAALVLRALTFGLVEVSAVEVDSRLLVVGLISAVMMGVIGGFFYAKVYNMIKKS